MRIRILFVLFIVFGLVAPPAGAAARADHVLFGPDAPTAVAGDIAVVGFNYDDPDQFAFVLLTNVTSGAIIKFTDNGWLSTGAFRTGEGTLSWTAPSDLCAGTVVTPTNVGTMLFSASGDQILAYEGEDASPAFVYALNSEGSPGTWQTNATSSNTSALPTGLTDGTTAVAIDEIDNAVYTGITSGTRAALLAAISNKSNWTSSDSTRQIMPAGPFTVTDAPSCGGDAAPSVSSTTPADAATGVAVNADVAVTFSEAVSVTNPWFTISCATSGAHTAAVSGGPTTFTLNPDADFANDEVCTVTIDHLTVTDQDADDPPDGMASDYEFGFTVAPAVDAAPSVSSTTPADNASGVARDTTIQVNFSEAVDLTASAVTMDCPAGTPVSLNGLPASGSSVTLTPTVSLPVSTTCVVTVSATGVSDQDLNDPPQNMTANSTFDFATAADVCAQSYTRIYAIQGSGNTAVVTGTVTTQGVVVGDWELPAGSGQVRGFYLQDTSGDSDAATSDGIFVYTGGADTVIVGQVVRVTGTAVEYQDQTQISSPTIVQCGTGSVTPVDVNLPVPADVAGVPYLERFEGMLVRLPQTLYVTEQYHLGRFGQVLMTPASARLRQPTDVAAPGAAAQAVQAANNLNRIIVDDDNNNQNPDPIIFGRGGSPLSAANTLRGGDTATGIVGVLVYGWGGNSVSPNAYRVRPSGALSGTVPSFVADNARPAAPTNPGGTLRVTSANLLNYFNTFGTGACTYGVGGAATDCRGAESTTEFDRQWPKTVANLVGTGADVIGLMELENDGYGGTSAIADLTNKLNAATAAGTYAYIDADTLTSQTNVLGTDAIKVGLIYKPAAVTPVGTTAALNTGAFGIFTITGGTTGRNRPALAQTFQEVAGGEQFTVVVNHLKSKGSGCDDNISPVGSDPDTGDGQGTCNLTRKKAAEELVVWLATDPTGADDSDYLIIGDLNSYALEDPVTAIKAGGFTDLLAKLGGSNPYSYVYDGQWGYLDHALGSQTMSMQVSGVSTWHINSDEPIVLDYNTNYKSVGQQVGLYANDQYRSADHDPAVLGLSLFSADWGDLPGDYGQAWHTGAGGPMLGITRTVDTNVTPGGDDSDDGVIPVDGYSWSKVAGGKVDVIVTGADGYVTGWIDWNSDGGFTEPGDQIFTNQFVAAGDMVEVSFPIPATAPITDGANTSSFYARFRVYSSAQTAAAMSRIAAPLVAASPTGSATGGEVEDMQLTFGPNAVRLGSMHASALAPVMVWPVLGLAAVAAYAMLRRRR